MIWNLDPTSESGVEALSVQAAKTRNGGRLLATLVGASILGLLLGVLR